MNTPPHAAKSVTIALLGAIGTWLLVNLMQGINNPDSVEPSALITWWSEVGTPSAAVSIIGWAGVIVGGYLTVIGLLGAAIGTIGITKRFPGLESIWAAVCTDSIRRILAAGLVTIYVSGPSMAYASGEASPIVLVDLGPVDEAPQIIQATTVPDDLFDMVGVDDVNDPPVSTPDTWTVLPGDHLWHIAERVLQDSGVSPSAGSTASYWRRLIAENISTIGPDPDLIFPGQILQLPTP